MSSPGIYESVMGGDTAPDDGFVDPFDAADTFDPAAGMTEEDFNSLYSGEPLTGKAQIYDSVQSAPTEVNNPRTADRASDTGGVAGKIVRLAESFVGVPYQWGGQSPSGFDCSGLLKYVFGKMGVQLPRVSYQQAQAGQAVSAKEARAGDIYYVDNSTRNNGADHVALYLGGGMILEAPRPGVPVRIRHLSNSEGGGFTRVL